MQRKRTFLTLPAGSLRYSETLWDTLGHFASRRNGMQRDRSFFLLHDGRQAIHIETLLRILQLDATIRGIFCGHSRHIETLLQILHPDAATRGLFCRRAIHNETLLQISQPNATMLSPFFHASWAPSKCGFAVRSAQHCRCAPVLWHTARISRQRECYSTCRRCLGC